jgi:hypothetical protein
MAVELSKLLRAKEEEDRDPAAKAAAWAELEGELRALSPAPRADPRRPEGAARG